MCMFLLTISCMICMCIFFFYLNGVWIQFENLTHFLFIFPYGPMSCGGSHFEFLIYKKNLNVEKDHPHNTPFKSHGFSDE